MLILCLSQTNTIQSDEFQRHCMEKKLTAGTTSGWWHRYMPSMVTNPHFKFNVYSLNYRILILHMAEMQIMCQSFVASIECIRVRRLKSRVFFECKLNWNNNESHVYTSFYATKSGGSLFSKAVQPQSNLFQFSCNWVFELVCSLFLSYSPYFVLFSFII